jgi:hypothetical protein
MTLLVAAASPSQELIAVLPAFTGSLVRLLLLQRSNGQLRTTLHHTVPTTSSSASLDVTTTKSNNLFFINESLVCLQTHAMIVVWDIARGVVAFSIDNLVSVASAASDGEHLYVLDESLVHQYTLLGKLTRKIKAGKRALQVAVTSENLWTRHERGVRVLSKATGRKVYKYDGDNGDVLAVTAMAVCKERAVCFVNATNGPHVCVLNGTSSTDPVVNMPVQGSFGSPESPVRFQVQVDGDAYSVLLDEALYQVQDDTLVLQSKVHVDKHVEAYVILLGNQGVTTAVLTRDRDYQVQSIKGENDEINFQWTTAPVESTTKGKSNNRATLVLGAAQAGGAAATSELLSAKRLKVNDDKNSDDEDEEDNGITVAERLQQLQKALEESDHSDSNSDVEEEKHPTFSSKRATTESLSQLLHQALQSGDDAMLELALNVRDVKLLQETCKNLSDAELPALLTALTTRLALKPGRAEALTAWLSCILQTGRIQTMQHLQPLQNLLQERVEVFPALLKLEGRLSMMGNV